MKSFIVLTLSILLLGSQALTLYNVSAQRYSPYPLIANDGSGFTYNFNPGAYNIDGNIKLLVRSQNVSNNTVQPSEFTSSEVSFGGNAYPSADVPKQAVHENNKLIQACGSEDPRVQYNSEDGLYYIFYTSYNCTDAMLTLATATEPADPESWIEYGYVFPQYNWSKSAAVLFADSKNGFDKHRLFWGDSTNPVNAIGIAESYDGVHWNDTGNLLLKTRSLFFDSYLVESGPPPVQLGSGDFLFIYNSARDGYPSVKPGWTLQYNAGFAILSKSNPTVVVQRSVIPLLSPSLAWEIGNTTNYNTPNVVFVTGLIRDPNGCHAGNYDCFIAFYGGADTDVGAARIVVNWFIADEVEKTEINVEEISM